MRNACFAALAVCALPALAAAQFVPPPVPTKPSALRETPAEQTAAKYRDKSWRGPRTSWGDPSFEGIWSTDDLRSVPFSRPAAFGNRDTLTSEEFLKRASTDEGGRSYAVNVGSFAPWEYGVRTFGYSSLIVEPANGQLPKLTPEGERLAASRVRGTYGPGPFDKVTDFSLYDRCITRGALGSFLPVLYGNGMRIVQTPTSVVISYEMIHDTRIIPLDKRPHLDGAVAQYMGNARGHWEGDTLVVETTNFTDKTNVGSGPNSTKMKLTERYTRVDPEMIEYRAVVDDPGAYTAPFALRMMISATKGYEMFEYSCHEGNGAVHNGLAGERAYEKQVADAKAKGLPPPRRAVTHDEFRNDLPEGTRVFDINKGE